MKISHFAASLGFLLPGLALIALGGVALGQAGQNSPSGVVGEFLFEEDGFRASLKIEGDFLRVHLAAPTTGWVAVGFDPSVAMKDANLIIGYVVDGDEDELYLRDDYGNGHTSHVSDLDEGGTSDFFDEEGYEDDGVTVVDFSIPLDSGDEYDRIIEQGESYRVLFAYGDDDDDDFTSYHSWAKVEEVTF